MKKKIKIKVFPTLKNVCTEAARIFLDLSSIKGQNNFIIPGGKTPIDFYQLINKQTQSWGNMTLLLSDERIVKEGSIHLNMRMVKKSLFNFNKEKKSFRLIPDFHSDIQENPVKLLGVLNPLVPLLGTFKAAFLGVGEDGHTASLFPGLEHDNNDNAFILVDRSQESFQRISISNKLLSKIPLLVFMFAGLGKREVLNKITGKNSSGSELVIQKIINNAKEKVIILCDQDAASDFKYD